MIIWHFFLYQQKKPFLTHILLMEKLLGEYITSKWKEASDKNVVLTRQQKFRAKSYPLNV